ncbi:MAG: hypothetical protein ACOYT9_02175 [Patescibacteria group bacterium]
MKMIFASLLVVGLLFGVGLYGMRLYTEQKMVPSVGSIAPPQTTVPPTMVTASVTPSVTTVTGFRYMYSVEVVEFAPNTDSYVGFRTCDKKDSVCTVYGIQSSDIAKATLGQAMTLSFDNYGNCGAALGTSYCYVVGKHELK